MASTMQITNSYKGTNQYKLIEFILKKYGKEQDILAIIQEGKDADLIHTSKQVDNSVSKDNKWGKNKWTTFQAECRRRALANCKPKMKRDRIKEIWNSEDYKQYHTEWDTVAEKLNAGISFKEVNMPLIPDLDDDFEAPKKEIQVQKPPARLPPIPKPPASNPTSNPKSSFLESALERVEDEKAMRQAEEDIGEFCEALNSTRVEDEVPEVADVGQI